jgi:hypothetical protein
VYIVARSEEKARGAIEELKRETGKVVVSFLKLDLGDLVCLCQGHYSADPKGPRREKDNIPRSQKDHERVEAESVGRAFTRDASEKKGGKQPEGCLEPIFLECRCQ